VRTAQWPFWLSWGLSLAMIIALACSRRLRYKVPYNYLFLVCLRSHILPEAACLHQHLCLLSGSMFCGHVELWNPSNVFHAEVPLIPCPWK
jgi:hypothetical protein